MKYTLLALADVRISASFFPFKQDGNIFFILTSFNLKQLFSFFTLYLKVH